LALITKQTQKNLPKARIISLSEARTNKLYIFWQCMYIVYISDQVYQWHKGCDHMVAALTTTCAISAYLSCQFELLSWWDVLDTTLCDQVWENHQSGKSLWQTVSPNVVSSTPRQQRDSNSQRLVVIHIDCTGTLYL
jgi:hypothetical protein